MWTEFGRCKGSIGWPRALLHLLRLESRRAFRALLLSVSAASLPAACSWRCHATFLTKLNIFLNRCGWGNSFRCVSTFADWESGRQKKKIWISKFSQPTGWWTDWWQQNLAWLWSINVSPIIKLAQQIKLCCNCAQFPVQLLLFTRGEYGRSMPCFPDEIDSLQWFRSRMPEAGQRKALLKIGRGQHTRMLVYI